VLSDEVNQLSKLDYLGIYGNPITSLNLDKQMLTHLRFLAAWNTALPASFAMALEQRTTVTKVNLTGKDLH